MSVTRERSALPKLLIYCTSQAFCQLFRSSAALQAIPEALNNATFATFCTTNGLALERAELASVSFAPGMSRCSKVFWCDFQISHSITLAGLSTLEQAAQFGYPSFVYLPPSRQTRHLPAWAIGLLIVAISMSLLVGSLITFIFCRRGKQASHGKLVKRSPLTTKSRCDF